MTTFQVQLRNPKEFCEIERLNVGFNDCRRKGEYNFSYDGVNPYLVCIDHAVILVKLGNLFNATMSYSPHLLKR